MAQVKVTITYDYGGDYDTNEEAIADELESWTKGTVGVPDILAAGDDGKINVEIIGDVGDEDVEDEDEDEEKAA